MAQTLLLSVYPPDKKGTALGLFSVTVLLAPVFGPLLGGWITDHISWPWVFFINVPIGMLCAYSCWMLLRKRETTIVKDPIDKMGLALTVVGVGALQIMFDQGRELDWFNSPQIILLAIVAAIALTALIIWELTAEHPIINLRLFGDRNFTVGTIAISLAFSLYMGIVVIQPLWLQTNMGYTASWAGLSMAPNGILAIFLMPLVGHYLPRLNMRLVVMLSIGIYALSCFLRVRFSSDISFGYLLLPQWLQGIAHAGVLIPLSALILSTISPQNIASAAGLTAFCRTLTTSLGTSLSTTLWDRRASVHYITYTEHISPYSSAFMNSAYSKIPNGYAMIEKVIGSQAYFASFIDLCWLYGWLFLLVAPIVWIAKKPKIGSAPVVVD